MIYKNVQKQFNKVIEYSQGIDNPQTDELFAKWAKAKEFFIKRFGGLVYEFPNTISFNLEENEKRRRINDFIDYVINTCHNDKLGNFIANNSGTFFDNKVGISTILEDGTKIPKDMKLIKAFKFFETNPTMLDLIQSHASQIIQENKIEGTLCLSVHPLDFLSVSQNTYNWRSCHSLDGDYRAGNLSYMTDKCTFICYLKGENDAHLPLFPEDVPWNSKKWRVLMYISESNEIMFSGRQYPFTTMAGLNSILMPILNILGLSSWDYCHWTDANVTSVKDSYNKTIRTQKYLPIRGRLYRLKDIIIDDSYELYFNDLIRSSCYSPHYTVKNNVYFAPEFALEDNNQIHIGGEVKCLCCGKTSITTTETMRCDYCEEAYGTEENSTFIFCECCERRIYIDESIVAINAARNTTHSICSNCYESECFTCQECGEVFFNNALKSDDKYNDIVCKECYNQRRKEENE